MLFFKYNSVMMRSWMKVLVVFFVVAWRWTDIVSAQTEKDSVVYTIEDSTQANQLVVEMMTLMNKRKLEEAKQKGELAKLIYGKVFGSESKQVANIFHLFGNIAYAYGNYDEAIGFWEKTLKIRLKTLGNEHSDVAYSYNNIGASYASQGKYGKAIEYHEKSLEIRLKKLGNEHPDVAQSYSNIGVSYEYQGAYDTAIEYKKKALEIRLKTLGNEHPDVARSYHNLGSSFYAQAKYEKAIEYYEKSLRINLKTLGNEHPDVAYSYNNIGVSYDSQGEYGKAIEYKEKALVILLKTLGNEHPSIATAFNNIGVSYDSQGKYVKALEYKKKGLGISLNALGNLHPEVADSYSNIGVSYNHQGEFRKAIEYKQRALEIRLKTLGNEHLDIGYSYINLGSSYYSQGEYSKAIGYFEKALDILLKTLDKEHPDVAETYTNIGVSYNSKGECSKAIEYGEKALAIFLKFLGAEHPDVATTYHNIGNAYDFRGEYIKAIEYYEKGIEIFLKTLGNEHPVLAKAYNNLGSSYHLQGENNKAIQFYSSALKALRYQYLNLQRVSSFTELFTSLQESSKVFEKQYSLNSELSYIHQSLSSAQEALAAIDYQSSTFTAESTKIHWQSTYHPIYEQAIDISLLAADINHNDTLRRQTFTYAEKSKATQLQAQLKNADALAFSGIPDSLTQQEYQLRVDLSWREKQRQGLLDQGKTETDSTVLRISSILFDLRQQYDTLKTRFEKNYPEYYRLKYDLRTVPLDYVQDSLLQPGQSLLEYFVGDSSIYLFLVQPKNYEVIEIKKDTAFNQWVEDLTRKGIYGYYGKKSTSKDKSINNFGTAAYQLYETLIAPIKAKLPKDEKLIIIPDGILGYVPFEALLTEKPPRPDAISAYKYLIQDHQISYCYSATLLKEMRNKKHRQKPTQKLLAMAPFFLGNADTLLSRVDSSELFAGVALRTRDTLNALPSSGPEVASINKILKGQAFYGKEATLQKFQKFASRYRILHLSTHGKADDRLGDYAYLAFGMPNAQGTFDKLYARDLYNLSLNADLVVLSACETGIGKLQRGEGIVSLARAFAYAGAKSIVTTLWKVNDEQSKNLMSSFYKYLSKGKDKDEALRLAKLEFLQKNEKKTELLHPFFWASFIGVGDMRSLPK